MKFIVERGFLSSIKEDRYEKKDHTEGIAYYLIVKERIGDSDDEFATQIQHFIRIKDNTEKVKFDSYVGKKVKLTGPVYGRKTKDNTSFFGQYVIDSIDDIEIVD